MADGITINYEFVQPEVGASQDTWGAKLNQNWADADGILDGLQTQIESITTGATGGLIGAGDAQAGYTLEIDIAEASDLRSGASEKMLDGASVYAAADLVVLAGGGSVSIDFDAGRNFEITLGSNSELSNPDNQKPGQSGVVVVRQDGTGGRALTYGSHWRFPSGPIEVAQGANDISIISYFVAASGEVLAIQARDFTT